MRKVGRFTMRVEYVNRQRLSRGLGEVASMEANETGGTTNDVIVTLYLFMCFSTLVLMTLTEQFENLPAAVVAFAAAWFILRL